jgi:hypothetical protein
MIKKSIAGVLAILLLINNQGCYSYNHIEKDNAEKLEQYDQVKINTFDEKIYILHDVVIQESMLKGYRHKFVYVRGFDRKTEIEAFQIPTQQIKEFEVYEFSLALTSLTVFLIIGIPIALFLITFRGPMF